MDDIRYIRQPTEAAAILRATQEINFPMASEPLVGALLRTLAASKPGGRFLELGTGTGVATAWLLAGMDAESTLESVDNDAQVQQIAEQILGNDSRLRLVTADCLAYLRSQSVGAFDLVFADAMPGKYEGLDLALAVLKPGGFYVADDMLPQPNWPEGHAAKVPVLMDQLASRPEFSFLPIIWASGVILAVRKPGRA